MSEQTNRQRLYEVLERSKEPFYCYEPYFNRTDGKPSFQWEIIAAAEKYKGRVVLAANRTGKSEIGAYNTALVVTGQHPCRDYPAEGNAIVVGLDHNMVRDIDRPLFEKFLPKRFKKKYYKQDNIWECEGDGRYWLVHFKSSESDFMKFEGTKNDHAWFDEEPKKTRVFTSVERGLVDMGGDWIFTATPLMGTAWLKALSEREDVFSISGTMLNNPYLPEEEVHKYAASLTEEERQVRIEGLYIVFGGRPVFRTYIKALNERLIKLRKEPPPSIGQIEVHAA